MTGIDQLEVKLNDVFGKQAPQLPENGKKMLVEWAPWISLIVGLFSLWGAWVLLQWAQVATNAADYLNTLCNGAYASLYSAGCSAADVSRFSLWVWLGLAVLVAEAVLYILAFSGLRDHKKAGWNFLYWGALLNIVYAVVNLFTNYNGVTNFVGALIGSAIGLWLLFQIRGHYTGAKTGSTASAK